MILRLLLSCLALIAILAVGIPSFVAVNSTDLAHPNDGDLGIVMTDPEAGAAGLAAVRRAVALAPESGSVRPSAAIASLSGIEAVALSSAEDAEIAELHKGMLRIVALSGDASERALAARRHDEALANAMFGMRLGRALARGGNGLVGMMFAEAYQTASLEHVEAVVRRTPLTAARARALIADLEAERWVTEDWFRAWTFEYQLLKGVLSDIDLDSEAKAAVEEQGMEAPGQGLLPASYLWQPNRTLAEAAKLHRERQVRSGRSCAPDTSGSEPSETFLLLTAFGPNAVGNILMGVARPDFARYEIKRCHLETRISLVQVLVAAKSAHDSIGELPGSLTGSSSAAMPDLPADGFRDAPVRYSAKEQRAWSVGSDFTPGAADAVDPADPIEPAISLDFSREP
jgi:hypothetical protein